MPHREFMTETTIDNCKNFIKQVFPGTINHRQNADLIATFMAGYAQAHADNVKACDAFDSFEKGFVFMEEMFSDAIERGKFIADSTDYTHPMFEQ